MSALTTPPEPRCAVKLPSSCFANLNGPRFETTITSGWARSRADGAEQGEPVLELASREEVAAHVLASGLAHRVGLGRVRQQLDRALGALVDRVDQVAVLTVADL